MTRFIDPQQIKSITDRVRKEINVKATAEEKANGWTDAKLSAYLAERHAQRLTYIMSNQAPKRIVVDGFDGFNPHFWNPGG